MLLETSGLQNAAHASFHHDVDGFSANGRMVAIRREELIIAFGRAPPISVKHCGNHIQNLIDVIVTTACDASPSPVLASGAAFFKMGRNFF